MRGHKDDGRENLHDPRRGGECRVAERFSPLPRAKLLGSHMPAAAQVLGFDHIYLTVSSLARSEPFYDGVLTGTLGFRKGTFTLNGEPHVSYFNRHFGLVLR